jgi:hypothetical protein
MKRAGLMSLLFAISLTTTVVRSQEVNLNNETDFRVKLLNEISSENSHKGDQVVAQVISPEQFADWYLEGQVRNVKSGKGRSELAFYFDTLEKSDRTGRVLIEASVKSVVNSQGKENVDEEGDVIRHTNNLGKAALMTGAGAALGALIGGGKGAAIGAGAGAAGALMLIEIKGDSATRISFAPGAQFIVSVKKR